MTPRFSSLARSLTCLGLRGGDPGDFCYLTVYRFEDVKGETPLYHQYSSHATLKERSNQRVVITSFTGANQRSYDIVGSPGEPTTMLTYHEFNCGAPPLWSGDREAIPGVCLPTLIKHLTRWRCRLLFALAKSRKLVLSHGVKRSYVLSPTKTRKSSRPNARCKNAQNSMLLDPISWDVYSVKFRSLVSSSSSSCKSASVILF